VGALCRAANISDGAAGGSAESPAISLLLLYIAATLLHGLEIFVLYRYLGFSSTFVRGAAWGMQGFVVLFRGLAIAELCREVFAHYAGIRAFIWRVLAVLVTVVMVLAMVAAMTVWS